MIFIRIILLLSLVYYQSINIIWLLPIVFMLHDFENLPPYYLECYRDNYSFNQLIFAQISLKVKYFLLMNLLTLYNYVIRKLIDTTLKDMFRKWILVHTTEYYNSNKLQTIKW